MGCLIQAELLGIVLICDSCLFGSELSPGKRNLFKIMCNPDCCARLSTSQLPGKLDWEVSGWKVRHSQPLSPWVHHHSVCWKQNQAFVIPGAEWKDLISRLAWKTNLSLNMGPTPREWCLRGHREPPNPPPFPGAWGS